MNMVRVTRRLRSLAAVSACFVLAALLGCGGGGSGDKIALKGKVIYNNAPVTGGTLTLVPADGAGAPFPISIKPDGTFEVGDAPNGPMKVTIETDSVSTATGGYNMPKDMKDVKLPEPPKGGPKKVVIPAKYNKAETSGLTWDTKAEKHKTITLTD
jgi:hypothetical protein